MLRELPYEMLSYICEAIIDNHSAEDVSEPSYKYRKHLAALRGTCRHIAPAPEYWLYRDVTLPPGSDTNARIALVFQMIDTLAKRPDLAAHVKRADLY